MIGYRVLLQIVVLTLALALPWSACAQTDLSTAKSDASLAEAGQSDQSQAASGQQQPAGQGSGGDSLIFDERGLKQVVPGESMSPWCPGTDAGAYTGNSTSSQGGQGGSNSTLRAGQGGPPQLDNLLQSLSQNGSAGNTDIGNMLKGGDISQVSNMVKDMLSGGANNSGGANDLGSMNINVPGVGDLDGLLHSAPEKLKKMQEYNEALDSLLKQ